jgi:hypothetical protein
MGVIFEILSSLVFDLQHEANEQDQEQEHRYCLFSCRSDIQSLHIIFGVIFCAADTHGLVKLLIF